MSRTESFVEKLIRQRTREHPTEVWLKFKDQQYTWQQVLSNAQRVAQGLLTLGARPGDRIGILLGNRPEFLWAHFGAIFLGAHSVPVSTFQRGNTLRHILADASCRVLIHERELSDVVQALRPTLPQLHTVVVVDGRPSTDGDRTFEQVMSAPDEILALEHDEAVGGVAMLYTSGTTGPPKGVVSTQYDMEPLYMVLGSTGVQPGETMYTCLPLFHGNALLVSAIGSMVLDAKLALAERFSARRFWADVYAFDAVQFNALGSMIPVLMKQPSKSNDADNPVRTVLSAGCPEDLWKRFEERFDLQILEFFGMVDSPGFLFNREGRVGSMGKPLGGVEFRVVDDNDEPLPAHEVGQLVFRHPKGQLTYYENHPAATREAYRGGWFHSGDLAEYDEEGYFYYRGRKKQSMRRRGENISAWEIESVVLQHPSILECAAHAVPSEVGEDDVKLTAVLTAGADLSPPEIVQYCEGKMASYAIPRYIEFVSALPKTPTQRVQYAELTTAGITAKTWDRERSSFVN